VVLAVIPVVVVDTGAGNDGDCAVCLAELEPGEKVRAPRCGHRFHVEGRGGGRSRRGVGEGRRGWGKEPAAAREAAVAALSGVGREMKG